MRSYSCFSFVKVVGEPGVGKGTGEGCGDGTGEPDATPEAAD